MFCSVIIPTIGRSSLERAITSILDQEFPQDEFEVIVVNDSGKPLLNSEWQNANNVTILNTNRRERSFARNSGAAIAKGDYLAFLDDDDWLLPGALHEFWVLASQKPESVWLYGGIRIVDEMGKTLAEMNSGLQDNCFAQIMGGAWAPIQASLIRTNTFFQVGGFSPFICGTEDEDLCRRIAYLGDFSSTSAVVACLFRGSTWNTSTNYQRAPADTKMSRDNVLAQPSAFKRLLVSAGTAYWYGRICRVYLSTVSWNLHNKKFFSAASRAMFSLAALAYSGFRILDVEFWKGINAAHVPDTLHYVIKTYEQDQDIHV
ncbi:MAG: glycosyltransferase [Anaerolineales bacterium]|nr:glycosyltransferase [Anaerolineales bacterium]